MNENFLKVSSLLKKAEEKLKRSGIKTPDTDAFELLCAVHSMTKADLILKDDEKLSEEESIKYFNYISDRARRIPLQYITGKSPFFGYDFKVNGNVLIPRFDTEILVEHALKILRGNERVLDLCTGSGCILISLCLGEKHAGRFNFKEGIGTDISEKAISIAKENAINLGAQNIEFTKSNLFEKVNGKFDLIVSNPPYIASEDICELEPEVKYFEPQAALDGGPDGLVFYREIIKKAPHFLNKGGHMMLEIGYNQAKEVTDLLYAEKFTYINVYKDYGSNDRVVHAIL